MVHWYPYVQLIWAAEVLVTVTDWDTIGFQVFKFAVEWNGFLRSLSTGIVITFYHFDSPAAEDGAGGVHFRYSGLQSWGVFLSSNERQKKRGVRKLARSIYNNKSPASHSINWCKLTFESCIPARLSDRHTPHADPSILWSYPVPEAYSRYLPS